MYNAASQVVGSISGLMITQKEIEKLFCAQTVLLDRTKLPFESRFAGTGAEGPDFSCDEVIARRKAIKRQADIIKSVRQRHPGWGKALGLRAQAHGSIIYRTATYVEPLAAAVPALKEYYDASCENNALETSVAVIAGHSPGCSDQDYWRTYMPDNIALTKEVVTKGLDVLHELGHIIFTFEDLPADTENLDNLAKPYASEVLADCWSICFAKEFGEPVEAIEDRMAERSLSSLFTDVLPSYYTAPAIEAFLNKETIPSFVDVFRSAQEIWVRTYAGLIERDTTHIHSDEIRDRIVMNFQYDESDVLVSAWDVPLNTFVEDFQSKPAAQVVHQTQKQVVECKNVNDFTRQMAQGMVDGFKHFCPEQARKHLARKRTHFLMPC